MSGSKAAGETSAFPPRGLECCASTTVTPQGSNVRMLSPPEDSRVTAREGGNAPFSCNLRTYPAACIVTLRPVALGKPEQAECAGSAASSELPDAGDRIRRSQRA